MPVTVSAVFADEHAARSALAALRDRGYRAALGHQQPAAPVSGVCPGSGRPVHCRMTNAALIPSHDHSVLTVLVTEDTAGAAAEILHACGGKTLH